MKQRGFTLIELMVFFVIGTTVLMIAAPALFGFSTGNSSITYGAMGMTESRCIEGYKFVMDQRGNSRQILDEFGKGVRCEVNSPGTFRSN